MAVCWYFPMFSDSQQRGLAPQDHVTTDDAYVK